jgi:hypothetical protein
MDDRRARLLRAPLQIESLRATRPPADRAILDALSALLTPANLNRLADEALPRQAEYLHHEKGLSIAGNVARGIDRARALGLDASPPLDILDIGAGPGFFCWVAQKFGHRATAIQPLFDGGTSIDFSAFLQLFGVAHSDQKILRQTPIGRDAAMPPEAGFDFVTAFAITFNREGKDEDGTRNVDFWSGDDYRFLLDDIQSNFLRPGGRVAFRFNLSSSPSLVAYYEALNGMLAPLVVSNDPAAGLSLELFRPEWRTMDWNLTALDRADVAQALEARAATDERRRAKHARRRRRAASLGDNLRVRR